MDTARDLTRADPWLESLERSLARRGKSRRTSIEPGRLRDPRGLAGVSKSVSKSATSARSHPRTAAKRPRSPLVTTGSLAALALLAAVFASALGAGGPQASPSPARAAVSRAAAVRPSANSQYTALGSGGVGLAAMGDCAMAITPTGYVDPLAAAAVRPERIDQGVDYAGSGMLSAIGAGRITYVATSGTGWPGTFIEYQLLAGADAGCYVFYAEGVTPARGLHVGDTVGAGQPLATIIPGYPTGIELGWGAGKDTKTYAAAAGQWSAADDQENVASPAGKNFSALIDSLGGPPGKVEG